MFRSSDAAAADGLAPPRRRVASFAWSPWMTVGASGAVAVGAGWATTLFAPRGPTTAAEALAVMALCLLVGMLGGALTQRRLVLVVLAIGYAFGMEASRLDVIGPTIHDIRFDSSYGIMAFVITRGMHALLAVLPMAFGVLAGRALAMRSVRDPDVGNPRAIGAVATGLATIALAVLVAWPASTPPVLGPDGEPVAGSLAELTTVRLGGADHAVMIRAADPDDPVLLYLAGGPGQSDLGLSRAVTTGWVQDFVFVNFDQRGNGKSYAAIDPIGAMTIDRAVADVLELAEHLRVRFDEEKVYLMGESWGTILGVLAVRERPDLFHAWIGSGQMVDVLETDRMVYHDLVAYAEAAHDTGLAAELAGVGEPLYRDIPWANANLLAWYEHLYDDYTPSESYRERGQAAGIADPFGMLLSEYSLIEKTNVLRGLIDTFSVLYPQLYEIDLRQEAPRLEVPVYILDGAAELDGRRSLALDWFDQLEAPHKELVTFEDAAHAVAFEQADAVQRLLLTEIVPLTSDR